MALSIICFSQPDAGTPDRDALSGLLVKARSAVQNAATIEAWPLTAGLFDIRFTGDAAAVDTSPPAPGGAVLVISFAPSEEADYATIWRAASALHSALMSSSIVICDGRTHHREEVPGGPGVAAIACSHRHAAMDRDAFMHHYLAVHVPLANALKPPLVVHYRTFRVLQALGEFSADSVTFQEFASREALDAFFQARFTDEEDEARADAANFIGEVSYVLGENPLLSLRSENDSMAA